MGIFDNVDLQQILPVALSAFAGAADPRSAQALGQSGWDSVRAYMQQQRMDQEKEEFQERLKLYQGEQAQRERELQIREKKFTQENEDKLDEDIMSEAIDPLLGQYEKTGEVPTASQAFAMYKELATKRGRKPNASMFMNYYNNAHTLLGKDGAILIKMNPKGGWDLYDKSTGQLWNALDKPVDPKKIESILNDYNALDNVAQGFRNRAEAATDEKTRAGFLNVASGLSNRANELRKEKEKVDYQALAHAEKNLTMRHGLEEKRMKQQFGEKDKSTGFYPGGPPNETEEQARERTRLIDEGFDGMYKRQSEEILGLSVSKVNSPAGRKEVVKKLKDREKLSSPYQVTGQDRILYEGLLMKFRPLDIPKEQKIAMARVGVEQMRGAVGREAEELKKGRWGGSQEKKPVSVKPERETEEAERPPLLAPREGRIGGTTRMAPPVAAPSTAGYVPYKEWISPTVAAERRRSLEYKIKVARRRRDEATAARLEEELSKLPK